MALRESEERFRLMVHGVTDYAIIMLDPDGNVSSWNAGCELVQGSARRMEPILKEAEVHCSVIAPERIVGLWDRHRIEQVLTNLLSNAGKYVPGGPVEISVSSDGESAKIAVRDRGPGISKSDQGRIFEPFERAGTVLGVEGLGLGLYIITQIVEAHGGHIQVESVPGEGTTFFVDLPLCAPEPKGNG